MQHPPQPANAIHSSSPLDSLVRRTSSRRANLPPPLSYPITPPRTHEREKSQDSPILHTRFRNSATTYASEAGHDRSFSNATWSRDDSYTEDQRDSLAVPRMPSFGRGQKRGEFMVDSVYSQGSYDLDEIHSNYYRESYASTNTLKHGGPSQATGNIIPAVVVSPDPDTATDSSLGGREPSRVQASGKINFSRPTLNVPPVDRSDDRKFEILRRNQQRSGQHRLLGKSPLGQYEQHTQYDRPSTSLVVTTRSGSPLSPPDARATNSCHPASRSISPNLSPNPSSEDPRGQPSSLSSSASAPNLKAPPRPPRPPSPVSLYSNYSYYQLDSPTSADSPASQATPSPPSPAHLSPHYVPSQKFPIAPPPPNPNHESPKTPQDYLQLGIQHHEAGRLEDSAACFEKSATLNGGCGVGMLFWGLTLRHGWGCEPRANEGFRWLRYAAEAAVNDLEQARKGANASAIKSELVLAIYEVGQSFFRGWGVEKDKAMGVSYFRTAAQLGDPDAQQELAFCLANGKGCKKDKKEAAHWYRAAVAQGVSNVGLAWIYKEKYM